MKSHSEVVCFLYNDMAKCVGESYLFALICTQVLPQISEDFKSCSNDSSIDYHGKLLNYIYTEYIHLVNHLFDLSKSSG